MANNTLKSLIDPLLISLGQDQEIIQKTSRAIEIAKIILEEIGVLGIESPDEILYRILKLPNAERYDSWFAHHPYYASERACFAITDDTTDTLEAKLYILKKKSRSMIAGAVNFTPNWEDADYTRDSSTARVGIDFFLTPTNSLIVALSNRGKLRIMELSDHMSNTQVEIFATWRWVCQLSTREAIHTTLWEALKLESVNTKFFLWVAQSFTDLIQHLEKSGRHHEESKLFASRLHGRLLFVWFLRKKHIIWERFDYFTTTDLSATEYYIKRLSPLFFECLNTPITERNTLDRDTPYLNGWLFDPKTDGYDWVASTLTFPEGFFDRLYTHFDQFNFTTDESTPDYEQIAIDPEMLGRIFENLLATQVEATGEQARKAKWAFYTPREIVSYMCRESLRQYLYTRFAKHESIDRLLDTSVSDWVKAGTNSRANYSNEEQRSIIWALDDITILDPACGSGAYPMGILQMMLQCYERLDTRYDPYQVKLQIIKNNLYWVDIEPMAVEIARLRAWLSLIVNEPSDSKNVKPLPNLDFKFVCANSLIPLNTSSPKNEIQWIQIGFGGDHKLAERLKEIRTQYFWARTPKSKKELRREFENLIYTDQTSFDDSEYTTKLRSYNPFEVHTICQFFDPEFMFGIEHGFDIVIGNPPYVQVKKGIVPVEQYPYSEWKDKWKQNLYKLFTELAFNYSKNWTGIASYILQSSLMCDISAEHTRELLLEKTRIIQFIEFPKNTKQKGAQVFESVLQGTSIFLIQKAIPNSQHVFLLSVGNNTQTINHLSWSSILQNIVDIYPNGRYIPLIKAEQEIHVIRKIRKNCKPLKSFILDIRKGDFNHGWTEKRFISWDNSLVPVLHWENIHRYYVDSNISDYVPVNFRLIQRTANSSGLMLVWQNITGTTDRYRFHFTITDKLNCLFGDKVNKIQLQSQNYLEILGVLNSKFIDWYFRKTSTNNQVNGYELQELPIPIITSENLWIINQVESLVAQILSDKRINPKANVTELERKIDQLVYELYELTPEEIAVVEGT